LLTKSTNTRYLNEISSKNRANVVVSFSLNPEPIADLWEGKWPDGERITRSIADRLEAASLARLAHQVAAREGAHICDRVALCDGYEPLLLRFSKWLKISNTPPPNAPNCSQLFPTQLALYGL
jgi:hypothetical protein